MFASQLTLRSVMIPQGTSLHIGKSLLSFDETDLGVNISLICANKVGRGSRRLRFFPEHERGPA